MFYRQANTPSFVVETHISSLTKKNVINKRVCTLPTKLEVCEIPSLQDREDFEGKERISSYFWKLQLQLLHRHYFNQVHHVAEGT